MELELFEFPSKKKSNAHYHLNLYYHTLLSIFEIIYKKNHHILLLLQSMYS